MQHCHCWTTQYSTRSGQLMAIWNIIKFLNIYKICSEWNVQKVTTTRRFGIEILNCHCQLYFQTNKAENRKQCCLKVRAMLWAAGFHTIQTRLICLVPLTFASVCLCIGWKIYICFELYTYYTYIQWIHWGRVWLYSSLYIVHWPHAITETQTGSGHTELQNL